MKKNSMKITAWLLAGALILGSAAVPVTKAEASEVSESSEVSEGSEDSEDETVLLPEENQGADAEAAEDTLNDSAAAADTSESDLAAETETVADETAETETSTRRKAVEIDENHVIPDGVHVNGEDISGLTVAEAREKMSAMAEEILKGNLTVTVGENSAEIPLTSFGMSMDETAVIEDICGIGEYGDLMSRYMELAEVAHSDVDFTLPFTFSEKALSQVIAYETTEFNTEPQDATLVRHGGEFIITPDQMGIEVDADATAAAVTALVADSWQGDALSVEANAVETPAEHTAADLEIITDELGSYSTDFSGSSSNRIANIGHGASFIDEVVLWPGEEFSFLEYVCPLNSANGYLEATGYSGGKVVPSIGGGICQVSSTLYNAVLRAELEIVYRDNHGMTVGYVPLAADATVSESSVDFKFRNNLETPIYIEAYTYGSSIYIKIYGQEYRDPARSIDFYSVTQQTIEPGEDVITEDASKPTGYYEVTQSAHTGYVASLYKRIYMNGSLQETVLINTSSYRASPRYITVGPSEPETESEPETSSGSSDYSTGDSSDYSDSGSSDDSDSYEDYNDSGSDSYEDEPDGGYAVD